MIKYQHILSAVADSPWAMRKEKLEQMLSFLCFAAEGGKRTDEEVAEIVAGRRQEGPSCSYLVDPDDGAVIVSSGRKHAEAWPLAASSADGSKRGKLVAVLQIYGVIVPKASDLQMSEVGTPIDAVAAMFRAALANPDVKAIVLDVDSPGGSVYGVDEMAAEIFAARGQKKIIAQVNPLAASAAYYLASQAEEIAVTPSGEAGSIGVYSAHQDISSFLEKKGVKISLISAGKYKVEGHPFGALEEDARAYMQQRVDDYYGMFLKAVAKGRGVSVKEVREGFGEGRVVGAKEAVQLGMADRVATLDETLRRLGAGSGSPTVAASADVKTSAQVLGTEVPGGDAGNHTASADNNGGNMENKETTTAPATAGADANQLRRTAAAIITLCNRHGVPDKAAELIQAGCTETEAAAKILEGISPKSVAQPAAETVRATATAGVQVNDPVRKDEAGFRLARMARAACFAKREGGGRREAARFAEETLKDPIVAATLNASTGSAGGYLVPESMASEVIELLRPASVVRSMNPVLAPMPNGTLSLPRLAAGASGSWIGESQAAPATDVSFDMPKLSAKKCAALIAISNDLLRYAGYGVDTIVRDDLIAAIAQAEDSAFIRGAGTAYTPKGLRYAGDQGATHILQAQSTPDLAKVTTDLGKQRLALRNANTRFLRPGRIISPRSETYLRGLRDGNGNFAFRDEMDRGLLDGFPFKVTTLIPDNISTDKSEVYMADFADVVIGEVPMFVLEVSTETAYDDGSGSLKSAFQRDQTVIKLIREVDLGVRHPKSISVLYDVAWGA